MSAKQKEERFFVRRGGLGMTVLGLCVLGLAVLAVPGARAQQNVAPPPNPNAPAPSPGSSDNGPSLADTMQFIQDKMNQQGEVLRFGDPVIAGGGPTLNFSRLYDVVADPAACTLRVTQGEPNAPPQAQYFASFKDITGIAVQSDNPPSGVPADFRDAGGGERNYEPAYYLILKADGEAFKRHFLNVPPEFIVNAKGKKVKNPNYTGLNFSDRNTPEVDLWFREEQLANRVAAAMNHAAELCGAGSRKEPF